MKSPQRVLLADDHALVRAGIRALLGAIAGVEVVGEASEGHQALQLIKELKPDVVVLDINMPGRNTFDLLAESVKLFPELRVIILTMHETAEHAIQSLRAGAAGFLPKSAAADELRQAVETVVRGEIYVSGEIARKAVEYQAIVAEQDQLLERLTPRQREILTLVANGQSTKQIARTLNISVKTVESHRAQLMERLNIHEVAGLVRYAIKMGLAQVD